MTQPQGQSRICPNRIDDRSVLFAHKVSIALCQDRQRGRYHKCYTCAHNNALAANQGRSPRKTKPQSETQPSELGSCPA